MSQNKALDDIVSSLELAVKRKRFRSIDFFKPYPKQQDFFAMGSWARERLLMAGNQLGKTYAGAAEVAYHLTGQYPKDWKGRKFDHPVTAWAAGETSLLVRDGPQKLLCGKPGVADDFGTGLIPRECFVEKPSLARGVTDAYDTLQVRHFTNGIEDGISTLTFKSYEQGREKFQSTTCDFIWLDEEPDLEIYTEALARITATKGFVFMTFTPLKGRSAVVMRYLDEPSVDRGVVHMRIDDALHIPPDERAKIIAGYPAHEREARANGVPMLGSGRIFTTLEDTIKEPRIENVPREWAKIWGVDFGIGHPFAAVLLAWDKDADVIHVLHTIRIADGTPVNHAQPMKLIAAAAPVAWPQDGTARDKGSGEPLSKLYRAQGLPMLGEHATWPDGGNSTEAGILELQEREASGRLKVADHLANWFEERRFYHRKDGLIVKLKDDLMSATRIGLMMRRFARPVLLGGKAPLRRKGQVATGVDFDVFR